MAKPLLDIHCIRKPHCKYPMQMKVAMDDGTVQTYNLETKQPAPNPNFMEAMEALDRMFSSIEIGYRYDPPKVRKYRRVR